MPSFSIPIFMFIYMLYRPIQSSLVEDKNLNNESNFNNDIPKHSIILFVRLLYPIIPASHSFNLLLSSSPLFKTYRSFLVSSIWISKVLNSTNLSVNHQSKYLWPNVFQKKYFVVPRWLESYQMEYEFLKWVNTYNNLV